MEIAGRAHDGAEATRLAEELAAGATGYLAKDRIAEDLVAAVLSAAA
jgi:DNA-binding NarL/FixJ family response regulator